MPKRKRGQDIKQAATTRNEETQHAATQPSGPVRSLISSLILLHFLGLIIALSANLAPSFLQGEAVAWLSPLHVTMGQDYIMLPLELTQAADMDAPVAVEVVNENGNEWEPLAISGNGLSPEFVRSSRWPNMARLLYWISQQQPDSEVLPEFAQRLLQASRNANALDESGAPESRPQAIRFVQPHVVSYDEDLVIASGRETLLADSMQSTVLYAARIVRDETGTIVGLIPQQDPALTSKPIASDTAEVNQ